MQEFDFEFKYVLGKQMVLPMHYHARRRNKFNLLGNLYEWTNGKPLYYF
jgi:hypothetical protein